MIKTTRLLLICLFFCGCGEGEKDIKNVLIGDQVLIDISKEMHFAVGKGIDSYVAYLINAKNDTIHIEYGRNGIIYDLHSEIPPVFLLSQKEHVVKTLSKEPAPDDVVFSEYADEDREEKIFDKNYYMYDTINAIVVKIVQPKRVGNGITGLFVPKLKDGNGICIYAKNLDSSANLRLLKMFRTIRYKEP